MESGNFDKILFLQKGGESFIHMGKIRGILKTTSWLSNTSATSE